ncbi:DUF3575 domain-containing protein [Muriicola sp.]|uniref:DUF3575 domain-containing protein n=1 Tax=Muriicola sp. TaxID=2020856 RepID=UPI003C750AE7
MKYHLALLVSLLYVLPSAGQDQMEAQDKEVRNRVGLMVTDLINGAYLLNYERALGKHIGVALNAGYKGDKGLLSLSGLDTDQIKIGDITYSGLKIVPEFRYYLNEKGSGMLTGFYFGAYLKFLQYNSDLGGTFINSAGESFEVLYEGKINVASGGLMVGYKLNLSKRLSIDFLIAGPGAGNYNFKLKNIIPPPDEFYDALNEALKQYSIFDLLNAEFKFTDNRQNTNLLLPEFRYGITLGYSF